MAKRAPIAGGPVGEVLVAIAAVRGWTQTELARRLGFVDPRKITMYLRGPRGAYYGITPEPETVRVWQKRLKALGPQFEPFIQPLEDAVWKQRAQRGPKGPKAPRASASVATPDKSSMFDAVFSRDEQKDLFELAKLMRKHGWAEAVSDVKGYFRVAKPADEPDPGSDNGGR